MIRFFRKRRAMRNYLSAGSPELLQRFGMKRWYSVEEVSRAVQGAALPSDFIAYAHAVFCERAAFDGYYAALNLRSSYEGLRGEVSRRFLGGARDFTAQAVVEAYCRSQRSDPYHESRIGINCGEDGRPHHDP